MRTGTFDAEDGLTLHYDLYPAARPRALVVLVHGYADHAGRYAEVAGRLAESGFPVLAFDYRGHGRASGARGHCDRFGEFVSDLRRAVALARSEYPDAPLVLLGHSHGGLIVLKALLDNAVPEATAAVVTSPYLGLRMKVSPIKAAAGRLASRLVPRLTMSNQLDPADFTHDVTIVNKTRADPLCHKVVTARWFTEAVSAQERVATDASRLSLPSLWLVGGADPIADAEVTRTVYGKAGGEKSIVVYDGFLHEILNESDRERVYADLLGWLSPRFPAA